MLAFSILLSNNEGMIERIGIVGGGQLGRMLTEAAHPLGFGVTVVDPVENCPAAQVGAEQIQAPLSDIDAITELAERTDVVTWEIEHIPAKHLFDLEQAGHNIQPSPQSLMVIQDKLKQKQFLAGLGIPVAPFSGEVNELDFLDGGPFIVKLRKGGFDGRGNKFVETLDETELEEHFGDAPIYVEQVVPFDNEVAVIGARDTYGNVDTYPLVETVHEDGICNLVMSPTSFSRAVTNEAEDIAQTVLKKFSGAGVFAIEMFLRDQKLMVNEIAPRVHNSGHLTIEANATSQFAQHIRAVTGMPLGATGRTVPSAVMINILGNKEEPLNREGLDQILGMDYVYPHFYGKSSRAARKIGHITLLGEQNRMPELVRKAEIARERLKI